MPAGATPSTGPAERTARRATSWPAEWLMAAQLAGRQRGVHALAAGRLLRRVVDGQRAERQVVAQRRARRVEEGSLQEVGPRVQGDRRPQGAWRQRGRQA